MSVLRFFVPGDPIAKGRARVGRNKKTGRPVVFTPKETRAYEKRVKQLAWAAMREARLQPEEGPVQLSVRAYFARTEERQYGAPHVLKPDASNILKAIEDGMVGTVFKDDAQVYDLLVTKAYACSDEAPGVEVSVYGWGHPCE